MKSRIPHPYTIIFGIIIVVALLTYIVPAGEFDRCKDASGRTLVTPGSYHPVERHPQGVTSVLMALCKGIQNASGVVAFVLVIGGAFGIINATGAVEAGLHRAISKLKGKESFIIPFTMTLFSIGGTLFGMAEETLPFYLILIPLCLAMGYDSLTAFMMIFLGAGIGCAASTFNPFCVGIAQAVAELPPGSGADYRFIQYLILLTITISFVMWHARRVKKDPEKSPVYEIDLQNREHFLGKLADKQGGTEFTRRHGLILIAFAIGLCVMVWGLIAKQWYIDEVSMVFLAVGLAAGLIAGFDQHRIAQSFVSGCKDLTYAAVIIGLARGILVIANDGKIIDTILNSAANALNGLPAPIFATLMLAVQCGISCLVPSSSGHAALTIPVLAPLGDLIHVHRQVIVTAYQYATGYTTMISPTAGTLMASLGIAQIPWNKWARFIAPLLAVYFILAVVFLVIGLYLYPVK